MATLAETVIGAIGGALLSGGAITVGTKAAWKFLVVDRIARAERDADEWKNEWKKVVRARHDVLAECGEPSLSPPEKADEDYDDNTKRIHVIASEDDARTERVRQRSERPPRDPARELLRRGGTPYDPDLQRYTHDMSSTPPDPSVQPVPRQRAKMPSRRD